MPSQLHVKQVNSSITERAKEAGHIVKQQSQKGSRVFYFNQIFTDLFPCVAGKSMEEVGSLTDVIHCYFWLNL